MAYNRTWAMEHGQIVPWLFTYKGEPIPLSIKKGCGTAIIKAAGCLLRSCMTSAAPPSATLSGLRAVSRSAAMSCTGHLTESVYRRYAIVDEGMLREAGAKLEKVQG